MLKRIRNWFLSLTPRGRLRLFQIGSREIDLRHQTCKEIIGSIAGLLKRNWDGTSTLEEVLCVEAWSKSYNLMFNRPTEFVLVFTSDGKYKIYLRSDRASQTPTLTKDASVALYGVLGDLLDQARKLPKVGSKIDAVVSVAYA